MGASFIPSILDQSIYSEIISVTDLNALETTKRLAKEEGLLVGISAGANVFAAIQIAEKLEPHQCVITMLCDTGERYLSVPFD
jgi:cysteine synthase A